MASGSSSSTTTVRVRRTTDGLPFLPWGLLPLVAWMLLWLFGVSTFANRWVEDAVAESTQDALASIGADWARASVDGQRVMLSGTPPSHEDAALALAAVRNEEAKTWLGHWAPASPVDDDFRFDGPAATSAEVPGPEWAFRIKDTLLTLTGQAPSEKEVDALATHAGELTVRDQLRVTGEPAIPGWVGVAQRGIEVLSHCDSGVARFSCGRLSVQCELPQAKVQTVEGLLAAALPLGEVGDIDLLPHEEVASCEQALAEILDNATIEFSTGSAAMGASSDALLDEVAAAARSCPGVLRVEGHTDDQGDPGYNQTLSDRRAAAVRDALLIRSLDANRMVAVGFGQTQPRADNATSAGRAENRRIEIRVVRASD